MNTPLEVCEQRDAKGLYKLARAGKIKGCVSFLFFKLLTFGNLSLLDLTYEINSGRVYVPVVSYEDNILA